MLKLVDVVVVFDDFETEELIGEWYVNFNAKPEQVSSRQALADYLAKFYAKQGKKLQFISVWKSKKLVF